MSLLSQLKDLKTKYLETNSAYLRTAIYIWGCIPDAADPGKATRRQLIPHFSIHYGLPEQVYEGPEAEYRTPEQEAEDVIA
jgi:hypothetical protein